MNPSQSTRDTTVLVRYTVNGMTSFPATHSLTVQEPTRVRVVNLTTVVPNTCPQGEAGPFRTATLQLLDHIGTGSPILYPGLSVSDVGGMTYVAGQNGCQLGTPITGTSTTNASGTWPDDYFMCTPLCPGSSCTSTLQQVFTVSGQFALAPVRVTYSCNNITIQP